MKVNIGGQELLVSFCEPLAEMPENLRWCPHREECDTLYYAALACECEDILATLHCDMCESDTWVVVGIEPKKGTLTVMEVPEEIGKEIRSKLREVGFCTGYTIHI